MKKALIAFAAAAAILATTVITTDTADAGRRGRAFVGGLILGGAAALLLAPHYRAYAEQEGYEEYEGYSAAAPVDCEGGYWAHSVVGQTPRGRPIYSEPRFFCPVNQ
jgi:hypothetical protein